MVRTASKLNQRIFKCIILGISWAVYYTCCLFLFGHFVYDRKSKKLVHKQRHYLVIKISKLFKLCFLLWYCTAYYGEHIIMTVGIWIFYRKHWSAEVYDVLVFQGSAMVSIWQGINLLLILHSSKHSAAYVQAINEVLRLHCKMSVYIGAAIYTSELYIVLTFLLKCLFTLLQIYNTVNSDMPIIGNLFFEIFYCSYFAYQLLIIGWLRAFIVNLEDQRDLLKSRLLDIHSLKKVLLIYDIYADIGRSHHNVTHLLWLPVAGILYAYIFRLTVDTTTALYIVTYSHRPGWFKWKYFVSKKLGNCLAPILQIFLIGLCNDRMAELEDLLKLLVFNINSAYRGRLVNYQTFCLYLQQHLFPIRNFIWTEKTCDRDFVLMFFFLVLQNVTSYMQNWYAVDFNDCILYEED